MSSRIVSDPDVMMGKPVVEGTRVTVETILVELGAGESMQQVLEAHPRLTRDDVLSAGATDDEVLNRANAAGTDSHHRGQGLR